MHQAMRDKGIRTLLPVMLACAINGAMPMPRLPRSPQPDTLDQAQSVLKFGKVSFAKTRHVQTVRVTAPRFIEPKDMSLGEIIPADSDPDAYLDRDLGFGKHKPYQAKPPKLRWNSKYGSQGASTKARKVRITKAMRLAYA